MGKLASAVTLTRPFQRINPTSVGKLLECGETDLARLPQARPWRDQPHKCGETPDPSAMSFSLPWDQPHKCGETRRPALRVAAWSKDQPHKCGETLTQLKASSSCLSGSTPQVWGNFEKLAEDPLDAIGSTPQVWGNLVMLLPLDHIHWDQPHKCGETTRFFARSREDQPHKCGETTLLGINPTRVGNHCLYYNQSTIHLWSMRIYSVPARAYNVATDHRSSPCAETRVAE